MIGRACQSINQGTVNCCPIVERLAAFEVESGLVKAGLNFEREFALRVVAGRDEGNDGEIVVWRELVDAAAGGALDFGRRDFDTVVGGDCFRREDSVFNCCAGGLRVATERRKPDCALSKRLAVESNVALNGGLGLSIRTAAASKPEYSAGN